MTLSLIAGPMFSGKTTELLFRLGDGVLMRPRADTRYGDDLMTHDRNKETRVATVVRGLSWQHGGTVGIDEAHLFTRIEQDDLAERVAAGRVGCEHLIVAGLLYKYNRKPFGWLGNLKKYAHDITILRARCRKCGQPTEYQNCLSGKIVNGGHADYVNECADCWTVKLQGAKA